MKRDALKQVGLICHAAVNGINISGDEFFIGGFIFADDIKGIYINALIEKHGGKFRQLVLVEHHLLLIQTATRRDINDEETAIAMARIIQKVDLLKMLYLLTVADSMATGPKAWNDWTEQLLKDLFLKTMGILKSGELASKKTRRAIDSKKKDVLALLRESWREEEVNRQLSAMSRRYLLYVPAQNIVDHINLHRNLGDREFIWQIARESQDMRTVSICGRDKPGFYSKIAGVFFRNKIHIVASQAYSLGDSHILDVFNVRPPQDRLFEKEKWEKAERELNQAIEDDHYLDKTLVKIPASITVSPGRRPEPNQVRIDNETSSFFTIIEVLTYDFPGLLFAVTNTLYRNGLNVEVAMVATKVLAYSILLYPSDPNPIDLL